MGTEKMSKSLGNVTLVHDLLKDWDGEVIRLALLKAHYRSELNWSEDLLKESKAQLDDWYRIKKSFLDFNGFAETETPYLPHSIYEDLNFPGSIFEVGKLIQISTKISMEYGKVAAQVLNSDKAQSNNIGAQLDDVQSKFLMSGNVFFELTGLLGLLQKDPEDWFKGGASSDDQAEFDAIALRRQEARAAKDWAAADAARDEATARGIVLEDGPDGTTWRKA